MWHLMSTERDAPDEAVVVTVYLMMLQVLLLLLPVEHVTEQLDVLDGQAEDFVFAQLLLRRVSRHQFPQFGEGTTDVLLAPPFTIVAESLARENNQWSTAVGTFFRPAASGRKKASDHAARFDRVQPFAEVQRRTGSDARTLRLVVTRRRRLDFHRHFLSLDKA